MMRWIGLLSIVLLVLLSSSALAQNLEFLKEGDSPVQRYVGDIPHMISLVDVGYSGKALDDIDDPNPLICGITVDGDEVWVGVDLNRDMNGVQVNVVSAEIVDSANKDEDLCRVFYLEGGPGATDLFPLRDGETKSISFLGNQVSVKVEDVSGDETNPSFFCDLTIDGSSEYLGLGEIKTLNGFSIGVYDIISLHTFAPEDSICVLQFKEVTPGIFSTEAPEGLEDLEPDYFEVEPTRFNKPLITVPWDENTTILSARIFDWVGTTYEVARLEPDLDYSTEWTFQPTQALIDDVYFLELYVEDNFDNNNHVIIGFQIDTTPPLVTVAPRNNIYIRQSPVPMKIELNELGRVKQVLVNNEMDIAYEFHPDEGILFNALFPMADGNKHMDVLVEDLAGNEVMESVDFIVDAVPLTIEILEPSFGVSNQPTFEFRILTSEPSQLCKQDGRNPDFNFDAVDSIINIYDTVLETNDQHYLDESKIGILNLQPERPEDVYVKCLDVTNQVNDPGILLYIEYDPSPPVIESAVADPARVTDLTLETDLVVVTDDRTRCVYTTDVALSGRFEDILAQAAPGSLNAGKFPGFDDANFTRENRVTLSDLKDKTQYAAYVMCQNMAEDLSSSAIINFETDLSEENDLLVNEPGKYVSDSSVMLEVITNKGADCEFELDGGATLAFSLTGDTQHESSLGGLADGLHELVIDCEFSSGSDVSETYTFTVDTTPPGVPDIADGEVSNHRDELEAVINASDDDSGIDSYQFAIGTVRFEGNEEDTGYRNILDWTPSSSSEVSASDLALENGTTYYFAAKVTNKAGLTSLVGRSDGVLVDLSRVERPEYIPNITTDLCFNEIWDITNEEPDPFNPDCGRNCPTKCPDGAKCNGNLDCVSGNCLGGMCFPGGGLPTPGDSDGDGMPDDWEIEHGLDPNDPSDAREDADRDGLTNLEEYQQGTDPNNHDTDGDGFWDGGEITSGTDPNDPNSKPPDEDGDFIDDNWELEHGMDPTDPNDRFADDDGDGVSNFDEYNHGTDPQNADTDGDGILDGGEITSNTDPNDPNDTPPDADGDGIDDNWERANGMDPTNPDDGRIDSDKDGLTDYQEYLHGTDPHNPDTDGDGILDGGEVTSGTDPLDPESHPPDEDGDGVDDNWELANGMDPDDPTDAFKDPDDDGLTNLMEYLYGTDPTNFDTDDDGIGDGGEVNYSMTEPDDPFDTPPDEDGDGVDDNYEREFGLDLSRDDSGEDPDGDGKTNLYEYLRADNPKDRRPKAEENDRDGDGFPSPADCDDLNPNVNPGAEEIKGNGMDDDCNPDTSDSLLWPWLLLILSLVLIIGGSSYLIYRNQIEFQQREEFGRRQEAKRKEVETKRKAVKGPVRRAPPRPAVRRVTAAETMRMRRLKAEREMFRKRTDERAKGRLKLFEGFGGGAAAPKAAGKEAPGAPVNGGPRRPGMRPPAGAPGEKVEYFDLSSLKRAKPKEAEIVEKKPARRILRKAVEKKEDDFLDLESLKKGKKAAKVEEDEFDALSGLISGKRLKKKLTDFDKLTKASKKIGAKEEDVFASLHTFVTKGKPGASAPDTFTELSEMVAEEPTSETELVESFVEIAKHRKHGAEIFKTVLSHLLAAKKIKKPDVIALVDKITSRGLLTRAESKRLLHELKIPQRKKK